MNDVKRLFINIAIMATLFIASGFGAHFMMVSLTRHNVRCEVPEFEGLIIHEARMLAERNELNIVINDSLYAPLYEGGMVLDQLPKSGVEVKPGRTIYVTINAFGQKRVTVPYVAGRSLRQAKNMLDVAGLQIEKLIYKRDMATNYVLEQYLGQTKIEEGDTNDAIVGSGITLHVGVSERDTVTQVPQLIGLTLAQAKSRLWESGLNMGRVKMPSDISPETRGDAKVYSQSIERGELTSYGTSVAINLTLDQEQVTQILEYIAAMEREREKLQRALEDSLARERILQLSQPQEQPIAEPSRSADDFFE